MKRRIIAALMCLCMLVGLLPTSVFAEKPKPNDTVEPVEYTASRVEDISGLGDNSSTNGQNVAAAIWETVENERFYVAVAAAKQHVDETNSKWQVYEGDRPLKVTVDGEEKFNHSPSYFGKNNTRYWYIAAFTKEEMSNITGSDGKYKFTLPPLPGGFQLGAITLPKDFVEEEILGLSVKKTVVKIGGTAAADQTDLSAQVGDTIIYKIEVKNTGKGTLTDISVADKMGETSLTLYSNANCNQDQETSRIIASLAAKETKTFYAAYTVQGSDAGKPLTNTVTATKGNTTGQDSVTVTVTVPGVVKPTEEYTVTYYANGGTGDVPVGSKYASGAKVTVQGNGNLAKTGAVFLGWSKNQKANITTEAEADNNDILKAGAKFDIVENTNLYAVWATDVNGNGTPDYKETTEKAYFYVLKPGVVDATVTAQQNFFYVGQGSIFENTQDVTKFTDNGVANNISTLPNANKDELIRIGANDIADKVGANFGNVLWYRIKTDGGANNNSGSIVAWPTPTRHVDGLLKPDEEHYTVLFAVKDRNGSIKSIVHSATFSSATAIDKETVDTANTAALAAEEKDANAWTVIWKDADGNDVSNVAGTKGEGGKILFFYADFAEKTATYTLRYDANAQKGGTVANTPDPSQHLAEASVTLSTQKPTHTEVINPEDEKATAVVFIGWTSERTDKIYSKNDAAPKTDTSVTMIVGGKTVYAAWGYDTNNNNIPDVKETKYTLTYHANGGTEITLPTDNNKYLSGETATLSTNLPKRETVDGKKVKCIGWSTTPDNNIYAAGENYGTLPTTVTFMNHNIDVYAVWGYDTNNNYGGHQSQYTLYYHPNFGRDQKANESTNKDKVEVQDYKQLTILPERDGYTFVSWNTKVDGSGTSYLPGDFFKLTATENHLYAQWQKDKTGPDDSGVSNWLETDEHNAYLTGYPDSTFRADRNMTRAEVAQMFYALLLDKNVTITKSFSDVPDDAWYATAVKTLASLGMMDGYPDGTFRPDEPITRAEFATVGLAFAYDPLDADCSYYDVSASAWYHTYVAQATTYGWIGGYPDNTFRPGNNITRVEVCVIVNNMLGRDADERYIDRHEDELVHFVDLSDSYWGYYTIMEATNTHEYTGSFTNEKWTDVK